MNTITSARCSTHALTATSEVLDREGNNNARTQSRPGRESVVGRAFEPTVFITGHVIGLPRAQRGPMDDHERAARHSRVTTHTAVPRRRKKKPTHASLSPIFSKRRRVATAAPMSRTRRATSLSGRDTNRWAMWKSRPSFEPFLI